MAGIIHDTVILLNIGIIVGILILSVTLSVLYASAYFRMKRTRIIGALCMVFIGLTIKTLTTAGKYWIVQVCQTAECIDDLMGQGNKVDLVSNTILLATLTYFLIWSVTKQDDKHGWNHFDKKFK